MLGASEPNRNTKVELKIQHENRGEQGRGGEKAMLAPLWPCYYGSKGSRRAKSLGLSQEESTPLSLHLEEHNGLGEGVLKRARELASGLFYEGLAPPPHLRGP